MLSTFVSQQVTDQFCTHKAAVIITVYSFLMFSLGRRRGYERLRTEDWNDETLLLLSSSK
jgi:hypothetical protein